MTMFEYKIKVDEGDRVAEYFGVTCGDTYTDALTELTKFYTPKGVNNAINEVTLREWHETTVLSFTNNAIWGQVLKEVC